MADNYEVPESNPLVELFKPHLDPICVSASFNEYGNPNDLSSDLWSRIDVSGDCLYSDGDSCFNSIHPVVEYATALKTRILDDGRVPISVALFEEQSATS